ncbi:MAG: hypothetical protein E7J02_12190 [Staphylococcus warneri]|nr:hypothetical protein [Staphylococcus warneri]MDU4503739.1 hypothetical protein [Staphylococcus warneri]
MYVENIKQLERLISNYQTNKVKIAKLKANNNIIRFENELKTALNELDVYYSSQHGQREIILNNKLYAGYYQGTFETEDTLLRSYYLDKKELIKEEIFDTLEANTQKDYKKLNELEEKQFEYEILFPDSPEEVDLSEKTFEKYKEAFNK